MFKIADFNAYLTQTYHNMPSIIHHPKNISETYGEVLYESVCKLTNKFLFKCDDVFLDLGSGAGKLVLAISYLTTMREIHGIEINADLHNCAVNALEKIKINYSKFFVQRNIYFSRGDFFDMDWTNSTILWIGSPCYTPTMLTEIAKRSENSSIRAILTLRPLLDLKNFKLTKIFSLECSWDNALCYIYEKKAHSL